MRTFIVLCSFFISLCTFAQTEDEAIKFIEIRLERLEKSKKQLQNTDNELRKRISNIESDIRKTNSDVVSLKENTDNLNGNIESVDASLKDNVCKITTKIEDTKEYTNQKIASRTQMLAIIISLVFILVVASVFILYRRFKSKSNAIDKLENAQKKISEAQNELKTAHQKLEEESIKIDSQLLEILNKQLNLPKETSTPDHSLALKIADEITRIEVNLSRMDPSVKGYKQLLKAVQRMKEDFQSKGYELTKLLGEKYVDGMKVIADFVVDDNLPFGSQIITSLKKPQIIYNGIILQAAEITVSQNI